VCHHLKYILIASAPASARGILHIEDHVRHTHGIALEHADFGNELRPAKSFLVLDEKEAVGSTQRRAWSMSEGALLVTNTSIELTE